MKLMTKLFICFGVFFILGTQAFANEMQIQNIDCSSDFLLHGATPIPNDPEGRGNPIFIDEVVPAGTTSQIISLDKFSLDYPIVIHPNYGYPFYFGLPSLPGIPYVVKFRKFGKSCNPTLF